MSIRTTINQYRRAAVGGKVAIGDVIRLTIDGAVCTAIVLDTRADDMHVTGFYEDGTRWFDIVRYADAWHATPGQIARMQADAPALELDLIALLCTSNMAKSAGGSMGGKSGSLTFMQARVLEMSKRDPARHAVVKAYLERMGKL